MVEKIGLSAAWELIDISPYLLEFDRVLEHFSKTLGLKYMSNAHYRYSRTAGLFIRFSMLPSLEFQVFVFRHVAHHHDHLRTFNVFASSSNMATPEYLGDYSGATEVVQRIGYRLIDMGLAA
jgi:hypothetical protein